MKTFSLPLLRDAGRLLYLQNLPQPAVGWRQKKLSLPVWQLEQTCLDKVPATAPNDALLPIRAAWDQLARASHDAETLAALLLVLCSSAGSGARCAAPLPWLRRTDIRPWLGDPTAVAALLKSLAPCLPAALRLLHAHEWLPLKELSAHASRLAEIDWFILTRCSQAVPAAEAETLTRQARDLLALSPPGRPWTETALAAQATGMLATDWNGEATGLAARVWVLSGAAWLRVVATMERADHVLVLRLLVETRAAEQTPPADVKRVLATLDRVGCRKRRERDLRWILQGLRRGAAPGPLAGALRVAAAGKYEDVQALWPHPETSWPMPAHFFTRHVGRLGQWRVKRTWQACATVPGLVEGLAGLRSARCLPWWALSCLLGVLVDMTAGKSRRVPRPAAEVQQLCASIFTEVRRLREKKAAQWIDTLDDFSGAAGWMTAAQCAEMITLTLRLTRLLEDDAQDAGALFRAMIRTGGSGVVQRLLDRPDSWWKKLASAAGDWVRRGRGQQGIRKMDAAGFTLLWSACRHLPVRWFDLMLELACVPDERVTAVFSCAAEHPLFACKFSLNEPHAALVLVDSVREERCRTNPASQRLRVHLAGGPRLPRHLLEHDLALLRLGWLEAQLHLMDELVHREIWRAFPGLKSGGSLSEHSVKLALTVDDNERPLRRLLRRHAWGEPGWITTHPLNRQWQAWIGEARAGRWREGIATVRVLPKFGEVTIAPEHDVQEILRMGSAVGSCLSLCACNSHAAAANALDANKLVVYARTADGKVIGRQLLAISEEKRLVCFSPYPVKLRGPLLEFFEDYDQVLAAHLGLPLHREGDYTIRNIVAKEWYDDGAWSRLTRVA